MPLSLALPAPCGIKNYETFNFSIDITISYAHSVKSVLIKLGSKFGTNCIATFELGLNSLIQLGQIPHHFFSGKGPSCGYSILQILLQLSLQGCHQWREDLCWKWSGWHLCWRFRRTNVVRSVWNFCCHWNHVVWSQLWGSIFSRSLHQSRQAPGLDCCKYCLTKFHLWRLFVVFISKIKLFEKGDNIF